jgi:hypothetical protein
MTTEDTEAKRPPPLPGECAPIPQVRAEIADDHGHVQWVVETHVVPDLDLDGYGSPVVLVPPDRQDLNQYTMWWRLFIQRGDCGHELGIVIGMEDPVLEPGESHGLRSFSVVEPVPEDLAGDLLQGIGSTTYVFDGQRYVSGQMDYR